MCLIKEKNMKHSFSKIYVGAIALLIGASSCSDQFLKDKKDYNNMTTNRRLLYLPLSTSRLYQDIILRYVGLIH